MKRLNPDDFIKLFNIHVDAMWAEMEVVFRTHIRRFGFPDVEIIYLDGQWYYKKVDIARYQLNNSQIRKIFNLITTTHNQLIDYSSKFVSRDWSVLSDHALTQELRKFIQVLFKALVITDVIVYQEGAFEQQAVATLQRGGFKSEIFDVLSKPLFRSYHKRRFLDLLQVKKHRLSEETFLKKWQWSETILFDYHKISKATIRRWLKGIRQPAMELQKILRTETLEKKVYTKVYRSLPPKLRQNADIMQELMAIRDWRVECFFQACHNAHGLLTELGERLGLSYREVVNCTLPEIYHMQTSRALARRRMKGYACVQGRIITGKQFKTLWRKFNQIQAGSEVHGTPANKGVVRGTARVILRAGQLNRLKKDEVLVCEQTTPDYFSAIRLASAIVTNVGGLTCHAAIVSREFGIPAVVGTGNATLVIRDGDFVEVDANKGIVRRLADK